MAKKKAKAKETTKIVKIKVNAWELIDEDALWDMVWDEAVEFSDGETGENRVPTSPNYIIKGVKNDVLDIEVEVEMVGD